MHRLLYYVYLNNLISGVARVPGAQEKYFCGPHQKKCSLKWEIGTKAQKKQYQNIYCVLLLLFFRSNKVRYFNARNASRQKLHKQAKVTKRGVSADEGQQGFGSGVPDAAAILQLFYKNTHF